MSGMIGSGLEGSGSWKYSARMKDSSLIGKTVVSKPLGWVWPLGKPPVLEPGKNRGYIYPINTHVIEGIYGVDYQGALHSKGFPTIFPMNLKNKNTCKFHMSSVRYKPWLFAVYWG